MVQSEIKEPDESAAGKRHLQQIQSGNVTSGPLMIQSMSTSTVSMHVTAADD